MTLDLDEVEVETAAAVTLDLEEVEVETAAAAAGLVERIRAHLAVAPVVIDACPGRLAHVLYKLGLLQDGRLVLRSLRRDEPNG